MADARPGRSSVRLSGELSQPHTSRRRPVCALRSLERRGLLRADSSFHCRLRSVLRTFWAERATGSHYHPDRPAARLLFLMALRGLVVAPAFARNSRFTDRTSYRLDCLGGSSLCLGRRREELEAASNRGSDDPVRGCSAGYIYPFGEPCSVESSDECVEQRPGSSWT